MSDLLTQSSLADQRYGFPNGTLYSLALTESRAGSNTGSIGNIFQITRQTSADPGYGLGPLDGNNPYDAGAYLYALQQGPAGGDLGTALAMYHGGPGNPTPYASNSPISEFLNGGSAAAAGDGIPTVTVTPNGTPSVEPGWFFDPSTGGFSYGAGPGNASPTSPGGVSLGGSMLGALSWLQELAIRALLVIVAVVLVAGGLYLSGQRGTRAVTIRQLGRSVL